MQRRMESPPAIRLTVTISETELNRRHRQIQMWKLWAFNFQLQLLSLPSRRFESKFKMGSSSWLQRQDVKIAAVYEVHTECYSKSIVVRKGDDIYRPAIWFLGSRRPKMGLSSEALPGTPVGSPRNGGDPRFGRASSSAVDLQDQNLSVTYWGSKMASAVTN